MTPDITKEVTGLMVRRILPDAPPSNIAKFLPGVLAALSAAGLGGTDFVAMALATIAAETAGFVPIPEGQSRYNTQQGGQPFALYDHRPDLGNHGPGMGAKYKGRGYIQITGADNYARIGKEIGVDLLNHPDLACDPAIAGKVLAQYLKDHEPKIRAALVAGDMEAARRAVNGGLHGIIQFTSAMQSAWDILPDDGT